MNPTEKSEKSEKIQYYKDLARSLGSRATTISGISRALIGSFGLRRIIDPSLSPPASFRRTSRREYIYERRSARIAEQLGLLDREATNRKKALGKVRKANRALPIYVRAEVGQLLGFEGPRTIAAWKKAAGSRAIPDPIQAAVAAEAYARTDWGRLRKTYRGENRVPGIRTETNGRSGWNCVSWHYADYAAILRPDGRKIWAQYPGGSISEYPVTALGTAKIGGEIIQPEPKKIAPAIRPHHLRRYYSSPVSRLTAISWMWDRQENAGYYLLEGEKYHTPPRPEGPASAIYREAVRAFSKRREEKRASALRERAELILRTPGQADRHYVAIEDSLAAGNCRTQTEAFAQQARTEIGAIGPCAVRADVILRIRDDSYSRRAVLQAIMAHSAA
ncbi:hypothetical protein EPN95_04485 [Patescibacteria group bacterium]|nr:MAG: hypothetical protein EPN95_04485 [Patescibacteria group bacterium]